MAPVGLPRWTLPSPYLSGIPSRNEPAAGIRVPKQTCSRVVTASACREQSGGTSCATLPRVEWTPARIRLFRAEGLCLPQDAFAFPTADAAPAVHGTNPTLESVELLRRTEVSELGSGTLEQLEELVESLGVDYFAVPPAEFRETVLSWRRYVVRLLDGKLTLRERRDLYAVAGWLSGLVAEASLALGDHAEPHCVTALSLAQEVGDARLAGWVRGTQAQIALYAGDPREAVDFARSF